VASRVQGLYKRGLINCEAWIPNNVHYETLSGSVSYGVTSDNSDEDICGFSIPPKEMIFPHLAGDIPGFGIRSRVKPFEQYQQHHIEDPSALGGRGQTHDITIYSIVKYFQLCMENNPNMVDSLFTPESCVLHATRVGVMVRENRRLFLHRGCWHKFKGYAYSQLHKMDVKTPQEGSKRAQSVADHGFDVKFAYHVVRLLDEVEQILTLGDLDLQRSREQLKAIRRGEWTQQQIVDHFTAREKALEECYEKSTLPYYPDEDKIKALLLACLEEHYGSLDAAVVIPDRAEKALAEVREVLDRYYR
jgi:predicted nucleotidyltransferase